MEKWKKEIFPKLVSDKTTIGTKEKIFEEAKKYPSKSVYANKANGAYKRARDGGFLDEACAHMPERNGFRHTLDTLKQLAKKFETRSEFARANSWAYMRASEMGLFKSSQSNKSSPKKILCLMAESIEKQLIKT